MAPTTSVRNASLLSFVSELLLTTFQRAQGSAPSAKSRLHSSCCGVISHHQPLCSLIPSSQGLPDAGEQPPPNLRAICVVLLIGSKHPVLGERSADITAGHEDHHEGVPHRNALQQVPGLKQ